jgi:hypothetical protein
MTAVAQVGVGAHEIALPLVDVKGAKAVKAILVLTGELTSAADVTTLDLVATEPQGAVEIGEGAATQDTVTPHREQGGGKVEGQAEGHPLSAQAKEHLEQGEMRLDHGAVQPIFLEAVGHFGVSHPGNVGMQDNGTIPTHENLTV